MAPASARPRAPIALALVRLRRMRNGRPELDTRSLPSLARATIMTDEPTLDQDERRPRGHIAGEGQVRLTRMAAMRRLATPMRIAAASLISWSQNQSHKLPEIVALRANRRGGRGCGVTTCLGRRERRQGGPES